MKWKPAVFLIVIVAAASYGPYPLSYKFQQLESDLRGLRTAIAKNKETIQVLKAEWAYENRPEVLQNLASKYLPLLLVAPYQVADLSELPSLSLSALDENARAVPLPRSKPTRKRVKTITPPTGPLHMATFSSGNERQGGTE